MHKTQYNKNLVLNQHLFEKELHFLICRNLMVYGNVDAEVNNFPSIVDYLFDNYYKHTDGHASAHTYSLYLDVFMAEIFGILSSGSLINEVFGYIDNIWLISGRCSPSHSTLPS